MIRQLREIHSGKPWMGPSFNSHLSGIGENQVFVRPLEDVHSIAEIISHLNLWRRETILKIRTGKGSKTDDCEENWLSNEKLQALGWDRLKTDYDESLAELIDLMESKVDAFLSEKYYDTDFKGYYPYEFVLVGMLHHDIYHLGQLGLIVKLLNLSEK